VTWPTSAVVRHWTARKPRGRTGSGNRWPAFAIDVESRTEDELTLLTGSMLTSIGDEGGREPRLPSVIAWRPLPGLVTTDAAPEGRGKVVHLTAHGRALRARQLSLVAAVEAQWGERFGIDLLTTLRTAAAAVAGRLDPELPGYVLVPWIGGTLSVHGAGGG
jgi:hypothetical protein